MSLSARPGTGMLPGVAVGLVAVSILGTLTSAPAASGAVATPAAADTTAVRTVTTTLTAAEQRIRTRLTARLSHPDLGTNVTGFVVDKATGRVVWSRGADSRRMPASTTKIPTALAVLDALGPAHRFATTVRRGVRASDVVLVGSGDPSLSSAQLARLATVTATDLRARGLSRATVVVDDSLFPAPTTAIGWRSSYIPEQVRWVRALVVDERHAYDTSVDTGKVFAAKLAANGVSVRAVVRGKAPVGARTVGVSRGQTLAAIVQRMLLRSDNDHAEALFRLTAHLRRQPTTWAGQRPRTAPYCPSSGFRWTT